MLASAAPTGAGAAASATAPSSSHAGLRARWPLMMMTTSARLRPSQAAAAQHPLAFSSSSSSSRKRHRRLVLAAPPPPRTVAAAAAGPPPPSSGNGGGPQQPPQQQPPDAAQAAKEALAAALLGGAGSSAYRQAAAAAAAAPGKKQQQQQARFSYSRAPPAASSATAATTTTTLPYGMAAAAERSAALNAPGFYTSEQAMSRQQRAALAAERSAALAAEAAAALAAANAQEEGPAVPAPGDLPGRARRRRASSPSSKDLTLSPRDWEGDALGDADAGRASSGNPFDAVPLLMDRQSGGDDLGLEAAARLPTAAAAAAEAQARAARRRERRAVLREAGLESKAAAAAVAAVARAGGASAAPPAAPRRRLPPTPPSVRAAERVVKFEAQALERAEATDAAIAAATARAGVVLVEGAYDPVDDLWEAEKWHPRRKLWSPVPTSPPREGKKPVTSVRNPLAPRYFRFQPVTSTLSRGWEAVFGPAGDGPKDPAERPRPPGSPWKALPAQLALETAPSPLERMAAALSAFALKGDGGRAIVFSEAMRLDGGAEAAPWLPKKIRIRPAVAADSEARRAGAQGGAQGAQGVAASLAAATAAAAPLPMPGEMSKGGNSNAKGGERGLVAWTPGRLLAGLVAGPAAALATAYRDPGADPAPRARAALDAGVPDVQSAARSFAYDAGYEYLSYSSLDRWAQAAMAAAHLAAAALALSWVYLHASQGLALGLALSWGLGTLSLPKLALLVALAASGRAWLYPAFFAARLVDRLVGWMGERLQAFFRAQALVWCIYLLLAPAHWHPLPLPWTAFTGA